MRTLFLAALGLWSLSLVGAAEPAPPPARGLAPLVRVLAESTDVEVLRDVLRGMHEELRGRRQLRLPEGWPAVQGKLAAHADPEIRQKALLLAVLFGDPQALASVRKMVVDVKATDDERQGALQTLVETRAPDLLPLLRQLLTDRALRRSALRGLAAFRDPGTPEAILRHYPAFNDAEKADAIDTLASRPEYALVLLAAMEKGEVPRRDLSAFTARQLLGFKNKQLAERLNAVWGSIRPPAQEKTTLLARYKSLVPPDALQKADRSQGRAVFARTCASCHTLFQEGGKVGPDLTGSQRANPDYLLAKLLDPNAVVGRDYQVTNIVTTTGRLITGIVGKDDGKTVSIQTQNELIALPVVEIEERHKTTQSIMPEGMLTALSDVEVRNLFAYLAGPGQVALPAKAP